MDFYARNKFHDDGFRSHPRRNRNKKLLITKGNEIIESCQGMIYLDRIEEYLWEDCNISSYFVWIFVLLSLNRTWSESLIFPANDIPMF